MQEITNEITAGLFILGVPYFIKWMYRCIQKRRQKGKVEFGFF